jgi:hypothetical protein
MTSEEMQELDSQLDGQESDTTDTSGKKRMILGSNGDVLNYFPSFSAMAIGLASGFFFRIVYDQDLSMLSDYQITKLPI